MTTTPAEFWDQFDEWGAAADARDRERAREEGEMSQCNRCSLTAIEERAKRDGQVVTTLMEPKANPHYGRPDSVTGYRKQLPGFPLGEVALVHPPGVSPDKAKKRYLATKKKNEARGGSGVFFAAWFGEITRHCEC